MELNREQQQIKDWLLTNKREPTEKDFLTYIQAYKKYWTKAKGPFFEDVHFCYRNNIYINNEIH